MEEDQLNDLELDEITLWTSPKRNDEVMEDREMWRLNIELLPPQPSRKTREMKKEEKGEKAN